MYYFASDIHLGLPAGVDPAGREQLFVRWLAEVAQDAEAIFLVGDIFDFWYEYRHVVPKGFTRTLGKLSELTDRGIPIHFFGGNHDIWTFRYLHDECGITLHHAPYTSFELYGQRVIIGHGDVLGPRPAGQRILSGVAPHTFFNPASLLGYVIRTWMESIQPSLKTSFTPIPRGG